MGERNYGYFNNVTDPIEDYRKESLRGGFAKRFAFRSVYLEPPLESILHLVEQAINEGEDNGRTYRPAHDVNRLYKADDSWYK